MGSYNDFRNSVRPQALGKIQEKRAMQATVRNNPNATAGGIGQRLQNLQMAGATAKSAQAAKASGGIGQRLQNLQMAGAKAKSAQAARTNSLPNQMQSGTFRQSGFAGIANNLTAARGAATISPMQPTPISPTAFSNPDAIRGVFGQANEGTFTRTVGDTPLMQMDDASMIGADMALNEYGQVQMPPMEVETPITPTYDLNNL